MGEEERFEILGELGRGGMATVYLADDRVRDERVALKVLHPHLSDDPEARARLIREVRATRDLTHPHVLVPYDVHEDQGRLALSMPLHRGQTLADRVALDGPLSPDDLEALAKALSSALAAAHERGVLHRDVTPANVLVGEHDGIRLTDFGLARIESQATATRTAALGTVGYTAPEVYGGERAGPRSDLYALGGVLYLAATGKPPWGTGAPMTVLKRQLEAERTPLRELRPDLPAHLLQAIEACLARDRDDRPPSARELSQALTTREVLITPIEPECAPSSGLTRGLYTVIVAERSEDRSRRRALRGSSAPLALDPKAERERALARAVGELAGLPQPRIDEAMKRPEFKLAEAVDHRTAEQVAGLAVNMGFSPRIAEDPHVRFSKVRGQLDLAMGMVAALFAFVAGTAVVAQGSWMAVAAMSGLAIASVVLVRRYLEARRLFPALPELVPGATTLPSQQVRPTLPDTEVGRVTLRVTQQLDRLEETLDEQASELAPAAVDELSQLVNSLRDEGQRMGRHAERLRMSLEGEDTLDEQSGRIGARLRRLEALRAAGETIDAAELAELHVAQERLTERATQRDAAESEYTRLLARLLDVGAAATRTTLQLSRGEGEASVRDLLARLGETTRLAEATREELSRDQRTRNREREPG